MKNNPLLKDFDNKYGIPPFEEIKIEHYLPAFKESIERHKIEINEIIKNTKKPDFENVLNAMEMSGSDLNKVSRVFYNLLSADSSDELNKIASEISPVLSRHNDEIILNQKLFSKIKVVYEQRDNLDSEQRRLTEVTYKAFKSKGSLLDEANRKKLQYFNEELSTLSLKFNQNVLKETNNFNLVIDSESDLDGLPDDLIHFAKEQAIDAGMDDMWVFKPTRENLYPFLTSSLNRDLREQLYKGYLNRGKNSNSENNEELVKRMAKLRKNKANLLGYDSHADLALDDTMAENKENVFSLLDAVWDPAINRANEEISEMQKIIQREGNNFKLEAWDWWHYSEKLRKEKYDFSEAEIKPYLSLKNIRLAAFKTAERLFEISFHKIQDHPKYHEDLEGYEVLDQNKQLIGIFFTDYFARPSKQGGAWMTSYRDQSKNNGDVLPMIINVCNFPKPKKGEPTLLNLEHAITLFHEFGHALHGLLSNVTYPSLSGTSVPRDYVEFPSQMMENWIRSPEVLFEFATHYETGEKISEELMSKYIASQKFNQGFATTEYLAASYLDLAWHTEDKDVDDINEFERKLFDKKGLPYEIDSRYESTYFSHIFAGGYSSSYYSYMWSEVLDSSAFEGFEKNGLFNKDLGKKLKELVYSSGNSKDLMSQFKKFNGSEPNPLRLLKKRGLA
ncbi:M3 family metallopeptidase [SAR86 cluster bacterium]|nr:M3 family metallopeptidase [SAR86 cluster bacterium]